MNLRKLGTGHWDRKLIERMLENSFSDNIDDALKEWMATGNCWWPSLASNTPDWVSNHQNGVGYCLCGHTIYYHFEITNTETGVTECVGSDHINAYMIARNISNELGLPVDSITEAQINDWVKVRVKNMKADAWWEENGEWFNGMLEGLREVDRYFNYQFSGRIFYEPKYQWNVRATKPRKKSEGKFGDPNYQMASVFWRWDDERNSRAQINGSGYPNDSLLADIVALSFRKEEYAKYAKAQEEKKERRLAEIQLERLRHERELAERRVLEANRKIEHGRSLAVDIDLMVSNDAFRRNCRFYGLERIRSIHAYNYETMVALKQFALKLSDSVTLSEYEISRLGQIYADDKRVTEKQIKFIEDLGGEAVGPMTRYEASQLIKSLLAQRDGGDEQADTLNQAYSPSAHQQNRSE